MIKSENSYNDRTVLFNRPLNRIYFVCRHLKLLDIYFLVHRQNIAEQKELKMMCRCMKQVVKFNRSSTKSIKHNKSKALEMAVVQCSSIYSQLFSVYLTYILNNSDERTLFKQFRLRLI